MQRKRARGRSGLAVAKLGLGLGLGLGYVLTAQMARAQGGCTFTDQNGKTVFWPNCVPPTEAKTPLGTTPAAKGSSQAPGAGTNPAQSFPYPGETPATLPAAPGAASGAAGGAGSSSAPAASRFPFPESDSSGKANEPGKPGSASGSGSSGPGNSGGSSSSSSGSSDGFDPTAGPLGDGDTDPAAEAAAARRAERMKRERDGLDFQQTPSQREIEDLKVASFYEDTGDYRGAYLRAVDAVSLDKDDASAHLALADAARKLGKLDEAESHYKKCLALDPVPKVRRAAERALKEMTAGG